MGSDTICLIDSSSTVLQIFWFHILVLPVRYNISFLFSTRTQWLRSFLILNSFETCYKQKHTFNLLTLTLGGQNNSGLWLSPQLASRQKQYLTVCDHPKRTPVALQRSQCSNYILYVTSTRSAPGLQRSIAAEQLTAQQIA